MIKREHYIKQIRDFYDSDLVKVITGIRRCGKSTILNEIKDEIAKKSDNIIYINFEDVLSFDMFPTYNHIIEYVNKIKKPGLCYLFFDEIQNVEDWAIAIRTLRLNNCSIFISGSNSKLLSKEFLKELAGRHVSFEIRPFVYKEIVEYCEQLKKPINITDYLVWGGFPKRFEMNNNDSMKKYLQDLNNTVVINDLIARYKIRDELLFIRFVNYVLKSNSRIFSVKSIYDAITKQGISCSINTIGKYLNYLKEAFVIVEIPQYSCKAKKELQFYSKLYDMDVSFNSLRVDDNRYDLDHNMENVVYNELIYMGYNVKVFNIDGKEIDFRAEKDGQIYFIQVAYSVMNEKAYNREFAALAKLDNLHQKILITNDELDYSTSTVKHIKLKDFLLMNSL